MILTGRYRGLVEEVETGKARIEFEVNEMKKALNSIPDLRGKELKITISKNRKRRSLSSNAYYHVLINAIAGELQTSSAQVHNIMLRRYGQVQVIDDQALFMAAKDTEEVRTFIDNSEEWHLKPTSEVRQGKDGFPYRTYLVLKGSSEYDTKEMARLIDGVVSEAQELGIETLPPHELERMKASWTPS